MSAQVTRLFKIKCVVSAQTNHGLKTSPASQEEIKAIENVSFYLINNRPDHPCKSHDHDHQWVDLVMT